MPGKPDYRVRTLAVRDAARERLRQLRSERMAKRSSASSDSATEGRASVAIPQGEMWVSHAASRGAIRADSGDRDVHARLGAEEEYANTVSASGLQLSEGLQADGDAWSRVRADDDAGMVDPEGPDGRPETSAQVAQSFQKSETVAVAARGSQPTASCDDPSASLPTPAIEPPQPQDALQPAGNATEWAVCSSGENEEGPDEAMETSDLAMLPGAGSGLVWMLGQCGIRTLDELGRADAEGLAERMGLVGQLLDLQSWIDFARCSTERPPYPADGDGLPSP